MKFLTHILLCSLLAFGCQKAKVLTYEQGLANCQQKLEEKMKTAPGGFYVEPPDCIIGAQIPEFEATTIEGAKITRESLKGKPTLINFWFTTCAPCVAEIPGLNTIVNQYGNNKVNFIAIGRENTQDIREFLAETPWKFQQIPDGLDLTRGVFKLRWGFPTTFLLNKEAEIVQAFSGGITEADMLAEIRKQLNAIL